MLAAAPRICICSHSRTVEAVQAFKRMRDHLLCNIRECLQELQQAGEKQQLRLQQHSAAASVAAPVCASRALLAPRRSGMRHGAAHAALVAAVQVLHKFLICCRRAIGRGGSWDRKDCTAVRSRSRESAIFWM